MPDVESLAGIVIRTTAVRESDLIANILTRERGVISAVARGARKSKRRFMGGIDLFDCGKFELSTLRSRSDLLGLQAFNEREMWLELRNDLLKFSLASSAIEITRHFAQAEDPDGGKLFAPLYCCLRNINAVKDRPLLLATLCYFILDLLRRSGVDPLHASPELSETSLHWIAEMLVRKEAYAPARKVDLDDALQFLLHYSEETIGKELESSAGILLASAR